MTGVLSTPQLPEGMDSSDRENSDTAPSPTATLSMGRLLLNSQEMSPIGKQAPEHSTTINIPTRIHPWAQGGGTQIRCTATAQRLSAELRERMASEHAEREDPQVHPKFRWKVFVWEFVNHMFQPFLLPLTLYVDGYTGAKNKLLIGVRTKIKGPPPPIVLLLLQLFYWAANAMFFFLDLTELRVDAFVCTFLLVYRNFVVAVKYAFYPPSDYDRVHEEPNMDLTQHLVLAWVTGKPSVIEQELENSQARSRIDLKKLYFALEPPSSACGVDEDQKSERDALYCVPAELVVREIIDYVMAKTNTFSSRGMRMGSIMSMIVVFMVYLPLGDHSYDSFGPYHWVCRTLFTLMSLFSAYSTWGFLVGAVIHYHRLAAILHTHSWAVGFTPSRGYDLTQDKVTFQHHGNVTTWLQSRMVLLDFGSRFEARMTVYISYAIVNLIIMVVVSTIGSLSGWPIFSDERVVLIVETTTVFMAGCIGAVIYYGAKSNQLQRKHAAELAVEKLRIRDLMSNLPPNHKAVQPLELAIRAIGEAKRTLDGLFDMQPVKVFGVRATFQLLTQFFTYIVTFVLFLIRVLVLEM